MVRVFPISSNQPNEMALTICNSISRNCFRLMRDRKLESLANGKEISPIPFRTEKEDFLWRKSTISVPFTFQPKFSHFFAKTGKKSKGGRYSCFETPFDEGKSAFCSTLYISKQRKFVTLSASGGTFLICTCVKEISPETLRFVFWSKTPC